MYHGKGEFIPSNEPPGGSNQCRRGELETQRGTGEVEGRRDCTGGGK